MKHLALALTFLVATACGGGGGGGSTAPETTPPVPLTESAIVEQVLEACGLDETAQFQSLLSQLGAIVSGTSLPPTFTLTAFDLVQVTATVDIDVDNDMMPDFTGTIGLRDSGGTPSALGLTLPALVAAVNGGQLDALFNLLTTVPAGSQVVFGLTGSIVGDNETSSITSNITIVLGASGALGSTSGDFESTTGPDCATNFTWANLDLSAMTGPLFRPSGLMNMTVQTSSDNVAGTITFNGTATAAVAVTRNGGDVQNYTFNVDSGTLTPAP